MHRRTSRLAGLLAALAVAATLATPAAAEQIGSRGGPDGTNPQPVQAQLATVRAATARFHDVAAAEAAGYVQASPCVALPDGGAMGYHFVRVDLLDDQLVPAEPEALLYAPRGDGSLRLVGVEYLSTAPHAQLFGQHLHAGPAGYALHVWLWQANPDGIFADFNPNVSC
jgi:hypothetical protein